MRCSPRSPWAGWLIDGSEPSGVVVYPLIVLSALAMGVQSAAVRRLAVADVSTTYIYRHPYGLYGAGGQIAALGVPGACRG